MDARLSGFQRGAKTLEFNFFQASVAVDAPALLIARDVSGKAFVVEIEEWASSANKREKKADDETEDKTEGKNTDINESISKYSGHFDRIRDRL